MVAVRAAAATVAAERGEAVRAVVVKAEAAKEEVVTAVA